MVMIRRIFLYLLINFLVVTTISISLNLFGIQTYIINNGVNYGFFLLFCFMWGLGCSFFSLMLSVEIVKWVMKVQIIDLENPGTPVKKRTIETVHRLAKKAGLEKMPQVGMYESEEPNAFATGPSRNVNLVAVSTGLVGKLDADEIEGVLGHEITHIVNGDMVTMTLLQGVINSFVMIFSGTIALAIGARLKLRSYGERILYHLFEFFFSALGSILLMAFSRWREFRADSGGAQLAGRDKMINALKALQKNYGIKIRHSATSISAFQIINRSSLASIFSSHPPLEERIKRLNEIPLKRRD